MPKTLFLKLQQKLRQVILNGVKICDFHFYYQSNIQQIAYPSPPLV
ncbi:hypothetical protein RINTHM_4630 [Richelia intracellularis HM01]|nr:hypothetical protein RINTHM_4630 [Richelia intracellularis HM01]